MDFIWTNIWTVYGLYMEIFIRSFGPKTYMDFIWTIYVLIWTYTDLYGTKCYMRQLIWTVLYGRRLYGL